MALVCFFPPFLKKSHPLPFPFFLQCTESLSGLGIIVKWCHVDKLCIGISHNVNQKTTETEESLIWRVFGCLFCCVCTYIALKPSEGWRKSPPSPSHTEWATECWKFQYSLFIYEEGPITFFTKIILSSDWTCEYAGVFFLIEWETLNYYISFA